MIKKISSIEAKDYFKSFEKKFIELDEQGFPDVIDSEVLVGTGKVEVIQGNYKVDKLIRKKSTLPLIITGDLVVDSLEILPDAEPVSVLGNITAENIMTFGELFCAKNIDVKKWVFGMSSNRGLKLLGKIKTSLLVCQRGYIVSAARGIEAKTYFDSEAMLKDLKKLIKVKVKNYKTNLDEFSTDGGPNEVYKILEKAWTKYK